MPRRSNPAAQRALRETQTAVREIRDQLRELRTKEGYVVVANIGPYDHNPADYALPQADYPRVYKALYQAVEAAKREARGIGGKVKIFHIEDTGSVPMPSRVVWRSWTPEGDKSRAKMRIRRTARSSRRSY